QAGAQRRCVQAAVTFGLMSVEAAERACSGGPGGGSRGIMVFGTPSTTEKIVSASQLSGEDKKLLNEIVIDFKTSSVSGGKQDVRRVMPVKSVSDVRDEIEGKICKEIKDKVAQAASGKGVGGPLSVEGALPITADTYLSLSRMEPSTREFSMVSICRQQSLVAVRAKILRLIQRFSQTLEGVSSSQDVPQAVRDEYRASLQRLLTDVDMMARQMEFERKAAENIAAVLGEQRRVEGELAGSATTDVRSREDLRAGLEYGTGR
ncbi:MAG: hypothetical protein ACE5JO_11910, partial [Candidatus Binatia bacterium]